MLHRLIKSRQAINDQMIYLLRSLTGKQVLLCQRKISGEHILIKELYLQVGLHLIIIQKLAIKLFIWHSRAMPRYLPRTNRIINCTNCPCQTVWQIPYFLKRHITTVVHEKLRPPLKILSTLRNPCKQHIIWCFIILQRQGRYLMSYCQRRENGHCTLIKILWVQF